MRSHQSSSIVDPYSRAIDELKKEKALRSSAKYKLDLLFGKGFSIHKPSAGLICFFGSGRALHGDGDTRLYICPGKQLRKADCDAFIPDYAQSHETAVCTKCGNLWRAEQLIGEVCYRLTPQKWAEVLATWFRKLESQADIRIIYPPDDIRSAAVREQEKTHGGELLEHARSTRATRAYPLENIMKDLAGGADLTARMLAFVRA